MIILVGSTEHGEFFYLLRVRVEIVQTLALPDPVPLILGRYHRYANLEERGFQYETFNLLAIADLVGCLAGSGADQGVGFGCQQGFHLTAQVQPGGHEKGRASNQVLRVHVSFIGNELL